MMLYLYPSNRVTLGGMIEMTRFQAFDLSNQIVLESITTQNLCRHLDCGKILRMHVPHQKPAKYAKVKQWLKN
jgi:hypothetical protein